MASLKISYPSPKRLARRAFLPAMAFLLAAGAFSSCEDEAGVIGGGLRPTDVSIYVDSTAFNVNGKSVEALSIDSRSTSVLLGKIQTPNYGNLSCSYVTQLMPAESISIPNSITPEDIDSVRLILRMPIANVTGDSLAPQQLKVYRLTQPLDQSISSSYNPDGKYDPKPLGTRNYTLSGFTMEGKNTASLISVEVEMPLAIGQDALRQYRKDPAMFQWPEQFAKEFNGLYVRSTFGKGCIGAVSNTGIYVFTHHNETKYETDSEGVTTTKIQQVADSTCFFSSAPEVISSNIITYNPSDDIKQLVAKGETIVTTPGGYNASIIFPTEDVLKKFWEANSDLGVINNLTFSIPAEKIGEDTEFDVPPTLLLVKKSKAESFFKENKVPDSKESFIGTWDSSTGLYSFGSLRAYIEELKNKQGEIKPEDVEFMIVPVLTTSESVPNSDGSTTLYYTGCVPYLLRPTMARLHTERARIVFTYSNQTIL